MRKLKFRAWDGHVDNLTYSDSDEYQIERLTENERLASFFDDHYGCEITQWTGLADKNGKEIYEGDICQYRDDAHIARVGVVHYSGVSCAFQIECIGGDDEGNQDIQCHPDYVIIVAGNIYETPEMFAYAEMYSPDTGDGAG